MKRSQTSTLQARKVNKERIMATPGQKSNYAKKRTFLIKHGGFGFDYPDKPWKGRD